MNKYFFLALMALTQAACSTPYHPPQFPDEHTTFPGLIDLAAQSQGKTVDVLLVHGMCTHDERWARDTVAQLTQSLTVNAPPANQQPRSQPRQAPQVPVQVLPLPVDTPAGRLRFDALVWSPLTQNLKAELCYDMGDKNALCQGSPPMPAQRARFNARAKDYLIDDCIADALIYEGVSHETMMERMRTALLQVLDQGQAPADVPLVVVAESLGSKYLFDTLLSMSQEAAGSRAVPVAQRTMDRMRYLVMAANQIPLLGLADQHIDTPEPGRVALSAMQAGSDSLQQLLQMRRARATAGAGGFGSRAKAADGADQRLVLVAFTDPNDLLSYTLQTEKYAGEGIVAYNILVSNASTWLGLFERPDDAHLNYLSNPDVGRLIACGQSISKFCK
jgi:hypothetical protein